LVGKERLARGIDHKSSTDSWWVKAGGGYLQGTCKVSKLECPRPNLEVPHHIKEGGQRKKKL
jgi:hypothetical protein